MNKCSFLIPVYPRDYHFLDFLNNIKGVIDFDIIFILSFVDDYTELKKYEYPDIYSVIILEDFLHLFSFTPFLI
jgi:hypothetical protein